MCSSGLTCAVQLQVLSLVGPCKGVINRKIALYAINIKVFLGHKQKNSPICHKHKSIFICMLYKYRLLKIRPSYAISRETKRAVAINTKIKGHIYICHKQKDPYTPSLIPFLSFPQIVWPIMRPSKAFWGTRSQ